MRKIVLSCQTTSFHFKLYKIHLFEDWTHWFLSCCWDLWARVFCVADKLSSRKCLAIISLLSLRHTHTHTHKHAHTECADTGSRFCVSDGGESSNSALSFSPLLSRRDLKDVSDSEKLSIVSSFQN